MTSPPSEFDNRHAETAARLVARARNGSASDQEALKEWAQSAPGRFETVKSMERSWDAVDDLLGTPTMDQWRSEAQGYLVSGGLDQERPGRHAHARTGNLRKLAVGLAAMVLLFVAGSLWFPIHPDFTIQAPMSGVRAEMLPDGSTVTLDRGSSLQVSFDDHARRVILEGQARFDVAHEETAPARPFIVRVEDREIMATGTKFNVLQETGRLEVSLMEGGVLLSALTEKDAWLGLGQKLVAAPIARLTPGQRFVEEAYEKPRIEAFNPAEISAWERGRIILDGAPLGRAAEIVSRYSAEKVIVADPELRDRRVSGAFMTGNVSGFAETIGLLYPDARIVEHSGSYVVTTRR